MIHKRNSLPRISDIETIFLASNYLHILIQVTLLSLAARKRKKKNNDIFSVDDCSQQQSTEPFFVTEEWKADERMIVIME